MATAIQVNASTQQAVGAFNALAQSIAATTQQFDKLNAAMSKGNTGATRYAGQITSINSAFNSLTHLASGALSVLTRLGAGVEFVFSAIIKELDKLQGFNAIMSVTTKSSEDVAKAYDFLRRTADRLGVQFNSLTGNYAKLVAALPEGEKGARIAERVFLGVANAARTLHSSNQDVQLMFYAITQIASKGVVSMEELRRQLGEKLPGVLQIAAKALNTIPETLEAAIRKGIVISEKFLPIFGDALITTFGDSAKKASESVSASINRLTNVWVDFVKHILDSGAGAAIASMFDAIREKLSDPYIIERFANLIKYLAEQFTEFVRKLTQDDIRNGFDSFTHFVEAGATVLGKLITMIQWIIDNGKTAGAIMGGMFGTAVGALAGPYGAIAGGAAGVAAGVYAGAALSPSAADLSQRVSANQAAEIAAQQAKAEQTRIKMTELIPLLQKFNGLNSLKGLDNLFKAENLNTRTIESLNKILISPEYKTDAIRAGAVQNYAKYGVIMGPGGNELSDVLGASKKKPKVVKDPLIAAEQHALGFTTNYATDLANYQKLFKSGKLDTEEYVSAVEHLIRKQPVAIEMLKEVRKTQQESSAAASEQITQILLQITAREKLATVVSEELRFAGMWQEQLRIEHELTSRLNTLRETGIVVTQTETDELRKKLELIDRTKQVTSAGDSLMSSTQGRRGAFENQVAAMQRIGEEPVKGARQGDSATMLMQIAPDVLSGTQIQLDAQVAAFADMYNRIGILRDASLISDQTAGQARVLVSIQEAQMRLASTRDFFTNLATLSSSGNSRIAAIGKAAALTQATIDGVLAIQKALAAPPGWPYNAAGVIAVGIAQAANVAKIAGFEEGGYTGDYATGTVAGVVHGQEFVSNAASTRRNRPLLEALNSGADVGSSGASPRVNIVINTPAGTATTREERDTPDGKQIEFTIANAVVKQVRRGGIIAEALESQYGLNRATGTVR